MRTSLTQALAEELPAPLASIKVVLADTTLVPWDAGTFGSRFSDATASALSWPD